MKKQRKDTRVHLLAELEAMNVGGMKSCPILLEAIELAKAGEFHDFKNQRFACGKVAAAGYLQALKTPAADAVRARLIDGEFDEEMDEQDKADMRAMLDTNGMGGPGFREIFKL